jgi:polar amino acid transport system substrate-binding protein
MLSLIWNAVRSLLRLKMPICRSTISSLETNEAEGWDYDVFNEVCVRLHCKPVYVEAAWDGMIQAVADGQFDMAGDGITITEERAEIVDFSDGYISLEQRLLVRFGEDRFAIMEEFVRETSK